MGNNAILIGASALVTALICLFLGYRWGRSNVRSQIENALDMARRSADAREFDLREQLDGKMVEVSQLRTQADSVPLLLQKIEQMQASRLRSSSGIATDEAPQEHTTIRTPLRQQGTPVADPAEKTIQHRLSSKEEKSEQAEQNHEAPLEKNGKPPVAKAPVKFPNSFTPQNAAPEPAKSPAIPPVASESPVVRPVPPKSPAIQPVAAQSPVARPVPPKSPAIRPVAAESPAAKPVPARSPVIPPVAAKPPAVKPAHAANNDDWDEFAKSLEAFRKK